MFNNFTKSDQEVLLLEVPQQAWGSEYKSSSSIYPIVIEDKTIHHDNPKVIGSSSIIRQGLGMIGTRSVSAKHSQRPASSMVVKTNHVRPVNDVRKPTSGGSSDQNHHQTENIPLNSMQEVPNISSKFDKRVSFYAVDELYQNDDILNEIPQSYKRTTSYTGSQQHQNGPRDEAAYLVPNGLSSFPAEGGGNPLHENNSDFMKKVSAVAATLEKATADEFETNCWRSFMNFLTQLTLPSSEKDHTKPDEAGKLLYWHKSEVEDYGTVYNSPIMSTDYVIVHYESMKKEYDEKYGLTTPVKKETKKELPSSLLNKINK